MYFMIINVDMGRRFSFGFRILPVHCFVIFYIILPYIRLGPGGRPFISGFPGIKATSCWPQGVQEIFLLILKCIAHFMIRIDPRIPKMYLSFFYYTTIEVNHV